MVEFDKWAFLIVGDNKSATILDVLYSLSLTINVKSCSYLWNGNFFKFLGSGWILCNMPNNIFYLNFCWHKKIYSIFFLIINFKKFIKDLEIKYESFSIAEAGDKIFNKFCNMLNDYIGALFEINFFL